ncbi:MAG: hypothetical protein KAZ48_04375 [Candidatus Nanopelagicales bacterium]|nr:hypothetical protein [Candidatus Nanopelagicales bacterium]
MTSDAAVTYELRVQGELDDHWADWLGDVRMVRDCDGTSTFVLSVVDQAQLHGLLARLRDIGVPLLSLKAVR